MNDIEPLPPAEEDLIAVYNARQFWLTSILVVVSIGLAIAGIAAFFLSGIIQRHERANALFALDELGVKARPIAYFGRGTPDQTDIGSFTVGSKFFESEQFHLLKPFVNVRGYDIENASMSQAARLPHLDKCRSLRLHHCDISNLSLVLKQADKLGSLFVGQDCYVGNQKQETTANTTKLKSVHFSCLPSQSILLEVFSAVDGVEELSISFADDCPNTTELKFDEIDFPQIDRICFNRWSSNEIELPIENLVSLLDHADVKHVKFNPERITNSDVMLEEYERRGISVESRQ